jgi:hypothetical protein
MGYNLVRKGSYWYFKLDNKTVASYSEITGRMYGATKYFNPLELAMEGRSHD